MANIFECDKCKKQVDKKELYTFSLPSAIDHRKMVVLESKIVDLCNDCTAKLAIKLLEFLK